VLGFVGSDDVSAQQRGGAGSIIDDAGPGANLRSFRSRRPGLWVLRGISNHIEGPNITAIGPPDIPLKQLLLVELFNNLFAQLDGLIQFLPRLLDPTPGQPDPGGGGSVGRTDDIVMTEVAHNGDVVLVELLSRSPIEVRLDGWRFADGIGVSPPLPVIELDRNASIVVQLGGETQSPLADFLIGFRLQSITAGELALYDFSRITDGSLPVDDPDLMKDYIQWDNEERDPPLEVIAQAANLWTSIEFINASLASSSFRLAADAEAQDGTSARDFIVVPFAENTLGVPESQLMPIDAGEVDLNDPN
jgi:hypothetical protein